MYDLELEFTEGMDGNKSDWIECWCLSNQSTLQCSILT